MDARQRIGMRRMVQVTLEQIAAGTLSSETAARALYRAGVPFNVIGRVTAMPLMSGAAAAAREAAGAMSARRAA